MCVGCSVDRCARHFFFFFNDTATTEIYTLSLHDALPISVHRLQHPAEPVRGPRHGPAQRRTSDDPGQDRSEEHTSELQSPCNLVCRLLLEKKKKQYYSRPQYLSTISRLPTTPRSVCWH